MTKGMKSKINIIVTIVGLLFIGLKGSSSAATISAASGRRADLQRALDQAVPGDTILIPAGDFPFDGPITLPAGIELRGAGRDRTILRKVGTYSVMITIDAANGEPVLFSGIKLVGTGDHITFELGLGLINGPHDFRVYESEFEGWGGHGLTVVGNARGVIDHCRFINCYVPGHGYGVYVWGDNDLSWQRPLSLGTGNAVFIEDCYFSGCRHAIASGYGARYVFRHNRIEANARAEAVNAHGPAPSSGIRGTRSVEIYNNTMIGGGPEVAVDGVGVPDFIALYSGDGVIFNNTLLKHSSSPSNYDDAGWMAIIDISYSCSYTGGYPMPDQTRQLHIWNNLKWGQPISGFYNWEGGDPIYKILLGVCPVEKQLFAPNRDLYEYPLPGYSPYVYPHPLANAGSIQASASASVTVGPAPLAVNFVGSASGGIPPYTYQWNFGDGQASAFQNPTHVYTAPGTYAAVLTVTDSQGQSDSHTLSIQVTTETVAIAVSISAIPISGRPPLTVNFTGSASGGAPPYSYQWDFGDGAYSTIQNASHTYESSGNFTAILTVRDGRSSTGTSSVLITVGSVGSYSLSLAAETGFPALGAGGTTEPVPGSYTFPTGSLVSLRSIPNINYRFSRWIGDILETSMFNIRTEITIDQNKTISSTFCTKCGDVNGDLQISPADAQAAFDIFLGKINNPSWCENENADVNSSGTKLVPKVTPADAQMIFHKFLKKNNTGDCSGESRSGTVSLNSLGASPLRLTIGSVDRQRGADIFVPIIVDSNTDISAFGIDLAFPTQSLTFLGIEQTEITQGFQNLAANVLFPAVNFSRPFEQEAAQGIVRVGGYRTESRPGPTSGVLVVLAFRVTGEIETSSPVSVIATYDDLWDSILTSEPIHFQAEKKFESERRIFDKRSSGKGYDFR